MAPVDLPGSEQVVTRYPEVEMVCWNLVKLLEVREELPWGPGRFAA
jgi:hypothetical protein